MSTKAELEQTVAELTKRIEQQNRELAAQRKLLNEAAEEAAPQGMTIADERAARAEVADIIARMMTSLSAESGIPYQTMVDVGKATNTFTYNVQIHEAVYV